MVHLFHFSGFFECFGAVTPACIPDQLCSEPVVIDVLWAKVATKVGTFLAKSMNLVPSFPHDPQIVKL
jgi:hypothetical protein